MARNLSTWVKFAEYWLRPWRPIHIWWIGKRICIHWKQYIDLALLYTYKFTQGLKKNQLYIFNYFPIFVPAFLGHWIFCTLCVFYWAWHILLYHIYICSPVYCLYSVAVLCTAAYMSVPMFVVLYWPLIDLCWLDYFNSLVISSQSSQ